MVLFHNAATLVRYLQVIKVYHFIGFVTYIHITISVLRCFDIIEYQRALLIALPLHTQGDASFFYKVESFIKEQYGEVCFGKSGCTAAGIGAGNIVLNTKT